MTGIFCSLCLPKGTFVTAQLSEAIWMLCRELMHAIAELYRQFALLYISSMVEDDTYFTELEKAWRERRGVLPTIEANSVLDIFAFIPYDI